MQNVEMKFYVPAGVSKGKVIMPQLLMSGVLQIQIPEDIEGQKWLSPKDYGLFGRPTLAELTHAFFGKYSDGKFISPGLRENILEAYDAEWLATYAIKEGMRNRIINNPESVYEAKSGRWKTKGGEDIVVGYVPSGWPVARDARTGWPLEIGSHQEAIEVYGSDASYFTANNPDKQLSAVLRNFGLADAGPFCVSADYVPDRRYSGVGGRACHRLEGDAKHLATPLELAA